MTTGIIISTQSLVQSDEAISAGKTAQALSKATGLPVIKMHRDAQARAEEKAALEQVANGSIVYITGHSSEEADDMQGVYCNPDLQENPIIVSWQLEQYANLILDNSSLKAGDHLTLVLWACDAGKGDTQSVAYKLGDLFRHKGIDTRIICSKKAIQRFNSHYGQEELDGASLRFRVYSVEELCVFDICSLGCTLSQNQGHLFFNVEGINGLALENPQRMGYPLEIIRHKNFHPKLTNASEAHHFLVEHPELYYVIRASSSYSKTSVYFTISYHNHDVIDHARFELNREYKLFLANPNCKPTELAFEKTGEILPVVGQMISRLKKHSAENQAKQSRLG